MKKLTQEYVEQYFKEYGCNLIDKYTSAQSKIKFKCVCGNISTTCWMSFRKGHRCRKCGNRKLSQQKRNNYQDVKNYFILNRCKLLSKSYKNDRQKLEYICQCGNKYFTSFNKFKSGQRCKLCRYSKLSEKTRGENHWSYIKDREKYNQYTMISSRCRSILRLCLNKFNLKKYSKTYDILGYNTTELIVHLESFPHWNDIKDKKWHIDHIFPIKAFCDYGINDLKIINCLENLRPLLASENLSKKDKYSKEDFEKWLESIYEKYKQ